MHPNNYQPNAVILREYDIRGTYGKNLFDADATWLGERFGSLVYRNDGKKVVVCRDGRKSSPNLHKFLCNSLVAAGLDVIDIGVGPTPMSYFAGYELSADATIMITGSHNPKDDNGIKITIGNKPFFGQDIQQLLNEPVLKNSGGTYQEIAQKIFNAYCDRLLQRHKFQKTLKIAWDSGNGASGPMVEALTKAMPYHEHILLYTDIDCDFPNHHPDPSVPENLNHLKAAIKEYNCDIGFAFDGDGDRIGVVDSTGRILAGDELVTIISKAILQEVPGGTIIADVKCSNTTFKAIKELGGLPIMGRTGHSWIKKAMAEHQAVFAGEMSGHMFFKHSYYGFDDGLFAAIFLLDYVQNQFLAVSDLVASLPKTFSTPEIRIPCDEKDKIKIVENLKAKLVQATKTFNAIDGVRVEESYGWWLVRASQTQAALIVRAEGNSSADLEAVITDMHLFGVDIRS